MVHFSLDKYKYDAFVVPIPIIVGNLLQIPIFAIGYILTYIGTKKEKTYIFELIGIILAIITTFGSNILVSIITNIYYANLPNITIAYNSMLSSVIGYVEIYNPLKLFSSLLLIAQALMIGYKIKKCYK